VLGSADGIATVRAGLEAYTTSRAIFDDLMKTVRLMHAHEAAGGIQRPPSSEDQGIG
jgi:hypothetical protein